jgi:hypothetical protein
MGEVLRWRNFIGVEFFTWFISEALPTPAIFPRTQTQKSRTPNQNRTLQTNVKKKKLLDLTVKIWDKNNLLLIFKSPHSEY